MKSKYIIYKEKGIVECRTEEINIESLSKMEVVIENESSIISAGTELARLSGLEKGTEFPFRPGYGSIGRILDKGEGVTDFAVGDRVFYAGKHSSVQRFIHGEGHQWSYLFRVPENIDAIDAAVGCIAQIAMTAPNITELRMGDTVAVFGLGMVGILAAMMYKISGARVIGVDPVKERCNLARRAGIETVIDCTLDKQVEAVKELTDGNGANVTIDGVGHSAVIQNCIKATALFGQVILLGSARGPFQGDLTDIFWDIHINELTIKGAHMFHFPLTPQRGYALSVCNNFDKIFELIKTRQLDVRKLISHVVKPEEVPAAYEGLLNQKTVYTGVVIDWK